MVARIALLPLLCLEDSGCLMPELPGGFKNLQAYFLSVLAQEWEGLLPVK